MLPTLWFRNTWSWGPIFDECTKKPSLALKRHGLVEAVHGELGEYQFTYDKEGEPLFTENETNATRLFGVQNQNPYVKDAFHEYIVQGHTNAVNPNRAGTKFSPCYVLEMDAGGSETIRLRLSARAEAPPEPFTGFDEILNQRKQEADEFYASKIPDEIPGEARAVARQGYAGLLWSKQFYHYVIRHWLNGDSAQPPPDSNRKQGRNREWLHLFNRDVISMPDKWEYPWFAAWDLAFHMIPMARVDPDFAKQQLLLFLREWYMHPNGQIPAYEFAFGDVNPPVHAWAAWRVYKNDWRSGRAGQSISGKRVSKAAHQFHLVGEPQRS